MRTEEINDLRGRILPILLFCQANKADLWSWKKDDKGIDVAKKYFYAYYSGLFCRILCQLEEPKMIDSNYIQNCNELLDKYNWYKIEEMDIMLFLTGSTRDCEVLRALEFIDGVDNVAWKNSGFENGSDAVCLKTEKGSWTFTDVRGTASTAIKD